MRVWYKSRFITFTGTFPGPQCWPVKKSEKKASLRSWNHTRFAVVFLLSHWDHLHSKLLLREMLNCYRVGGEVNTDKECSSICVARFEVETETVFPENCPGWLLQKMHSSHSLNSISRYQDMIACHVKSYFSIFCLTMNVVVLQIPLNWSQK